MTKCIEIINEEIKFPLDVKVEFNFDYKDELERFIKSLETIKNSMNAMDNLIEILKSKLE